VRLSKKMYFETQFKKNLFNLKFTWKLLFDAIKRRPQKISQNIDAILIDGVLITDKTLIANQFNQFYASLATDLASKIPPSLNIPQKVDINLETPIFRFSDNPITPQEILETFKTLKNKKTPDINGLSSNFISNYSWQLTVPLCHIFNQSIEQGIVPEQLKLAKIIPLFKSKDPLLTDNYRPISILNVFSKILEKLVHKRLSIFLESNNLLSKFQFGFRKNFSTTHPLTVFLNHLFEANNEKKYTLGIFCDLRKAFDTVDFEILLTKMYNKGVRGQDLEWFKNYLYGRKQLTAIGDTLSETLDILVGVPQGSILLFIWTTYPLVQIFLLYSLQMIQLFMPVLIV